MRRSAILAFAMVLLLARSAEPVPHFPHDAYIWQRTWTPSVETAMRRSAGFIRAWHVLTAEVNPDGTVAPIHADWAALDASGAPLVAVIRIDGRLDASRQEILPDLIGRVAGDDPAITGVEIDYDCPTSALPDYALALRSIRRALPARYALAITALPTWLGSSAFPTVLAEIDSAVLQVHAVDNPRAGLFDRAKAFDWAQSMGRISAKPFLLALPDYQVRVGWDDSGNLSSVTGEASGFQAADARELGASPTEAERLIQDIARDPPSHLAGLVWFRLPTDADRRSWSFQTWRAVIAGEPLGQMLSVRAVAAADAPGTSDLVVTNEGDADAVMPRAVPLPADCRIADGVGGYLLDVSGTPSMLRLSADRLIRAGEMRRIGWQRCG